MKIRLGFVSNSSASSFCIYGWHMAGWDALNEVQLKILAELPNRFRRLLISCEDPSNGGQLVGLGYYADEIDHDMADWESYSSPSPPPDAIDWLRTFSTRIGWGLPEFYEATWYNG